MLDSWIVQVQLTVLNTAVADLPGRRTWSANVTLLGRRGRSPAVRAGPARVAGRPRTTTGSRPRLRRGSSGEAPEEKQWRIGAGATPRLSPQSAEHRSACCHRRAGAEAVTATDAAPAGATVLWRSWTHGEEMDAPLGRASPQLSAATGARPTDDGRRTGVGTYTYTHTHTHILSEWPAPHYQLETDVMDAINHQVRHARRATVAPTRTSAGRKLSGMIPGSWHCYNLCFLVIFL